MNLVLKGQDNHSDCVYQVYSVLKRKGQSNMGMHLHLRHHGEAKRLPKPIQEYMKKRFILSDTYLRDLRCLEYEGMVGEKQVRRFSIFGMREADNKAVTILEKNDLDKNPKMILFEAYIDKTGKAYAADRRSPKTGKNTNTKD